jgi:hypothetical protein
VRASGRGSAGRGARTDLFFYGTLLDSDVRRLVLGQGSAKLRLERARLSGYRRVHMPGETAPVVLPRPGAAVAGLLCRDVDAAALARLVHFEGEAYRTLPVIVARASGRSSRALVFASAGAGLGDASPWRFDAWRRRHKRDFLRRMAIWMAGYRAAKDVF